MERSNRRFTPLEGMDERLLAEPPKAELIVDMQYEPRGCWRKIGGTERVDVGGESGVLDAGQWIHSFRPTAGGAERFILFEEATSDTEKSLKVLDLRDGSLVTLQSGRRRTRHPSHGTTAVEFNGWLYVCDGVNPLVRWHPDLTQASTTTRVREVGFSAPPGAPEVVTSTHLDVIDVAGDNSLASGITNGRGLGALEEGAAWEYGWAVVAFNDLGQASPVSGVTYAAGSAGGSGSNIYRRGAMLSVPGGPRAARALLLLRTRQLAESRVGQPPLYERATAYHGHGFDYVDVGFDQELGAQFDEAAVGPVPAGVKMAAIWQQTMFLLAQDQTVLYYSYPGFLEQFPLLNTLPVATSESGPITSIHAAQRAVLVLCERAVFVVKGNALDGFVVDQVASGVGSESGRGVIHIPGLGWAFLDPQGGPHIIQGLLDDEQPTRVQPIGAPIRETWDERVNRAKLSQARVVLDTKHQEVWWSLPEGGSSRQTLGLVFHYGIGEWSLRESWPIGAAAWDGRVVWFVSNDSANPGIYIVSDGSNLKLGSAFTCKYRMAWRVDGQERQPLQGFRLHALGRGDDDLDVYWRGDRENVWTQVAETARKALAPEWQPPRWGTASWSATELWTDYVPVVVEVDGHKLHGFEHQVEVRSEDRIYLLGIDHADTPKRGSARHRRQEL